MTASAATAARPGARDWRKLAMWLAAAPAMAFIVSTIPGVRPHAGYNLLLDGVLNNLAYEAAAVLCLLRVQRMAHRTWSSYLLPTALGLYGLGNVVWTIFIRTMAVEPFPSAADALFLVFYPLVLVALVRSLRQRAQNAPPSLWLDGLVGGLAVGSVGAAFVIGPIMDSGTGSWAAVATTAAYPLLDLVLLLLLAITLSLYGWRPPVGLWLLSIGLLVFVCADLAYLFETANNTYVSGRITDGVWVLGVLVMALGPGWPSRPTGFALPGWLLFTIPVGSTATALALLLIDHVHPLHPAALVLSGATVIVALLRLAVTFQEVVRLADSHELAITDDLTGLGNRRALLEKGPAALGALDPSGTVALLLLDLDRFKEVNDSLGHSAGDDMLCEVAARLKAFVPARADLVVRLGGDEFALLLTGDAHLDAQGLAEDVRTAISQPMDVGGVTLRPDASLGIASLPVGAAELSALLRQADVAMYRAKTQRLGVFAYRADQDEFASGDRLATIELLRETISQRRMVLHYQPKVDRETARASSVEALVRWPHPQRGLLYPDSFLPLVEHAGLMEELTASVLESALDQAAVWFAQGRELTIAVNLSAASLDDAALPDRVGRMLAERGLPGKALEVEITEDFLMGDRTRAQNILTGLREQGIRVAIDDYGTGYSSLSYLRELPVDELKLDKSFLAALEHDDRAMAIVRSTILLAHSLGMRLVAEGVEDATTSLELTEAGCDVQQGWYYAKALPVSDLERWLDEEAPQVIAAAAPVSADAGPRHRA